MLAMTKFDGVNRKIRVVIYLTQLITDNDKEKNHRIDARKTNYDMAIAITYSLRLTALGI